MARERLTRRAVQHRADLVTKLAREVGLLDAADSLGVEQTGNDGAPWELIVDHWARDVNGNVVHHGVSKVASNATLREVDAQVDALRWAVFALQHRAGMGADGPTRATSELNRAMDAVAEVNGLAPRRDGWDGWGRVAVLRRANVIRAGYTANLLVDWAPLRVWVERVGKDDGAPCNDIVTIERRGDDGTGPWAASTWNPRSGRPVEY